MTAPAFPSPSEWDALGQKLNAIPGQANSAVQAIFTMVNNALGQAWLPSWVADWIKPILAKLVELTKALLQQLGELLVGFFFPVIALVIANDWNAEVKNPVNQVSGVVSDANLHVGDYWQGSAATAYTNAVTAQTGAMTEVAAIIDDVKSRLYVLASALFFFYGAVATILVQWIEVMVAATAADVTGVLAIFGIPIQVGETAISGSAIATAVLLLIALVGAEAESFTTLDGRITSGPKFPKGHWPTAVTDILSDASEKGGDVDKTQKWHIK